MEKRNTQIENLILIRCSVSNFTVDIIITGGLLGLTNHCECDIARLSQLARLHGRGEISSYLRNFSQLHYHSYAVRNLALDSLDFTANLKQFMPFDVSSQSVKIDKNKFKR